MLLSYLEQVEISCKEKTDIFLIQYPNLNKKSTAFPFYWHHLIETARNPAVYTPFLDHPTATEMRTLTIHHSSYMYV